MNYSRVYKKIKPSAVKLSREIAPKLWKSPKPHRKMYAIKWLLKMSKLYGIKCPKFVFDPDITGILRIQSGGGAYNPGDHTITLYGKYSFVTLAHEFRHAVHFSLKEMELYKDDIEEDAKAWSLSLFRKACPNSYKKALERGTLKV